MSLKPPRVFVSYSHDSEIHKEWVLNLATRLRQAGVDAILDLWELEPGDDLALFMERNLTSADRVLMICSEKYVEKANSGKGGVGYEKMIVTADLMRSVDSNKVIPIIRQGGTRNVPVFLGTKKFLDFSREEQFEFSFDELVRSLHNSPLFMKPEIGEKPTFQAPPPVRKIVDPIFIIMKVVVQEYEANTFKTYLDYSALAQRTQKAGLSRLYFDAIMVQILDQGLLYQDKLGFYYLTEKGRQYAFENQLS